MTVGNWLLRLCYSELLISINFKNRYIMITREFKFKNGDEVREKVSGFKGVITGTCFYLTGCNQYLISAESKENKEPVALWYDEGRIELVKNEKIKERDVEADENGCDLPPLVGKRGC